MATITYHALDSPGLRGLESGAHLLLLGEKEALELNAPNTAFHINMALKLSSVQTPGLDPPAPLMRLLTEKLSPSFDAHATLDTWLEVDGTTVRVTLGCLPAGRPSRHNCPAKPHAATEVVKAVAGGDAPLRILVTLASVDHAVALGTAIARAFPLYNNKSKAAGAAAGSAEKPPRKVEVVFNMTLAHLAQAGVLGPAANNGPGRFDSGVALLARIAALGEGVRLAARLVDAPPNEMHTDAMVEEAGAALQRLQRLQHEGVGVTVIRGEELREKGFGGLYGVGKAAERPPALVVLSSKGKPTGGAEKPAGSVVLVGKGIVYDTGGLSIKTKTGMPGMKRDMGGAAAVLAAFEAAVKMGYTGPLHAVLCLAENAVSAKATRPDDIHVMYSGKTVEINNTDAEGRLVLADGVAYAVKHLAPRVILDMATLTGAQGVATGKRHAAIYANDESLEAAVVAAGRETGDLAHPVPYAPEFFQSEFRSAVADMKNSVASRENAQCSCAAQFIGSHLGDWVQTGQWCHIDMAYPVHNGERATGFGVALLVNILDKL